MWSNRKIVAAVFPVGRCKPIVLSKGDANGACIPDEEGSLLSRTGGHQLHGRGFRRVSSCSTMLNHPDRTDPTVFILAYRLSLAGSSVGRVSCSISVNQPHFVNLGGLRFTGSVPTHALDFDKCQATVRRQSRLALPMDINHVPAREIDFLERQRPPRCAAEELSRIPRRGTTERAVFAGNQRHSRRWGETIGT